jgi:hypothetical protein
MLPTIRARDSRAGGKRMDRRKLIVTGLTAAGFTAAGGSAFAQSVSQPTQLPPARPGGAPPADYTPDNEPMRAEPMEPEAMEPQPYDDGAARMEPMPTESPEAPSPRMTAEPSYPARTRAQTFSRNEIVNNMSDFMGVPAEAAAGVVERAFRDNGQPTAYIAGEEGSAAIVAGLRYGKGLLYMKDMRPMQVFWQGPSVGWDFGGNASRVFTLAYNLVVPEMIFRRYPGVEGSAYFIGGLGVNYQRAEDVTLAPIRAGVGLRLGANVGYLAYSKKRHLLPF